MQLNGQAQACSGRTTRRSAASLPTLSRTLKGAPNNPSILWADNQPCKQIKYNYLQGEGPNPKCRQRSKHRKQTLTPVTKRCPHNVYQDQYINANKCSLIYYAIGSLQHKSHRVRTIRCFWLQALQHALPAASTDVLQPAVSCHTYALQTVNELMSFCHLRTPQDTYIYMKADKEQQDQWDQRANAQGRDLEDHRRKQFAVQAYFKHEIHVQSSWTDVKSFDPMARQPSG